MATSEWIQVNDSHRKDIKKQLEKTKAKHILPNHVEQSLNDIKNHYDRYMDVKDLDKITNH